MRQVPASCVSLFPGCSTGKLGMAEQHELSEIDGVGTYTICKIMAAIELGKRRQLATMGPALLEKEGLRDRIYRFPVNDIRLINSFIF